MHPPDDTTRDERPEDTAIVAASAADLPAEAQVHLPPLSIWPVTTAAGVALGGIGMVTDWPFWVLGILLMGFGLMSWVQELRHESH